MIRRFQIEDIIAQDGSGVVFRAFDTETGRMVAVRRFFPFGTHGGGLKKDEQTAYNIAIARLAGLNHPSLRSVICGGCDPVDGIPFIATEWIEGTVLGPIVAQRPLPADAVVLLLTKTLEVCELVSHVLAEEAVWVETDLNTIVLGNEESGRGFTFWISPLKWLGGGTNPRGLEPIIALTEKVMGLKKSQPINDQASGGLGSWLKWLRHAAPGTTLREARENLAAAIGTEPPAPAKKLVSAAVRPPAPKSSKAAIFIGFGLVLILAGLGGRLLTRAQPMPEPPELAALTPGIPDVSQHRPADLTNSLRADGNPLEVQRTAVEKRGGVFSPAESRLLALENGRIATLEGNLVKTSLSKKSPKMTYLYFSKNPSAKEARGALPFTNNTAFDASALIGKKIRFTGKVKVTNGRPQIEIADIAAIKVAE